MGLRGWLANDEALLIYDSYDIWQVDPTGKQSAKCLTLGGRQQKIRFRYLRLDAEQISIDPNETILLSAFHTKTKASGYFNSVPEKKVSSQSFRQATHHAR